MNFFREHIVGMAIFAIATGIAAAYLYDLFDMKPTHTLYGTLKTHTVATNTPGSVTEPHINTTVPGMPNLAVRWEQWDDSRAQRAAQDILRGVDWRTTPNFECVYAVPWDKTSARDCTATHRFIQEQHLAPNSGELVLLVYSSVVKESKCHACGVTLSAFGYTRSPQRMWVLSFMALGFTQWGNWGQVSPEEVEIRLIGPSQAAVLLRGGVTAQGSTDDYEQVYLMTARGLQLALAVQTMAAHSSERESQPDNWTSSLTFEPSNKAVFDIRFKTTGLKDKYPFNNDVLFIFDGEKYLIPTSLGL